MGTVYRARDTVLDREVALKTIRTGVEVEPELRERFYREARACARLQHPSIVVVHDLGEIDRTAYIAMELLRGLDFRKLIDARTEIALPVKIKAMAEVCDALAHAHLHGIIHRDIKPSNLFLVDGRIAKVLDFGIARLPSSRLTVAGKILGTPNYMAPEQIMVQPADARADLFSAAVVFFEFLVLAHPFKGDVISRRIVQDEPDSLFEYDSRLPAPLEKIFERAFAKNPDLRYQTGDEMAADFRAVLDAVLQNASPSFSRIQLPSDRELRAADSKTPITDLDMSLLRPPPPGEDIHEWHLSELMRLIPEFETAIGRRDAALARQAFSQLAAIGAVDPRFEDAVQLCRVRLNELEADAGAIPNDPPLGGTQASAIVTPAAAGQSGGATTGDPGTTPKTCGYCGTTNRRAAAYCIKCGGRLPAAPPAQPVSTPEAVEPVRDAAAFEAGTTTVGREPPRPTAGLPDARSSNAMEPEPVSAAARLRGNAYRICLRTLRGIEAGWRQLLPLPSRRLWTAIGAASLAFCLVAASIVFLVLRPAPVQPAVATAQVKSADAVLYEEARVGSSIATLKRGDRVNVLRIPRARDQMWLWVQFVGPKALRPGYVRVSDLRDWDSANPETKLALIRWFWNTGSASDDEIREETRALQELLDRLPGTKVAREAQLELAGLNLSAAGRKKSAGEPASAWRDQIETARAYLEAAKDEPSLNGRVGDMQRQIESLLAGSLPGRLAAAPALNPGVAGTGFGNAITGLPKKASKRRIDEMLRRAEDSWDQRNLDEAERALDDIEKLDHDNQKARELRDKVNKRRELLDKYGKGAGKGN